MTHLADPLPLARGPAMRNRLMLAPLTNMQSHADGTLSDDEYHWLTMRAAGGFALTMTCAAHVQRGGQGFPGQLGIFGDEHVPGLARLARTINGHGSLSSVQLQHSGLRAVPDLSGEPRVAPWDDAESGARALTTAEVEALVEDFVLAGLRAEAAGFHGVELHGAHGYLLCEFLDEVNNRRTDRYGGSAENRARVFFEIIEGLRARARPAFQIGVRLSPERFGISLAESKALAARIMTDGRVDYLDMSLWDCFKAPVEPDYAGTQLIDHFAALPRGECRLGVAGKIMDAATAQAALDRGVDYVLIGRGAILHHDFAARAIADPGFGAIPRPVTRAHLEAEGLGQAFINYMATAWKDFVAA